MNGPFGLTRIRTQNRLQKPGPFMNRRARLSSWRAINDPHKGAGRFTQATFTSACNRPRISGKTVDFVATLIMSLTLPRPPIQPRRSLQFALCLAVCIPSLLIFNMLPSSTAFNQAEAVFLWGVVLILVPKRCFRQSIDSVWPAALLFVTMGLAALLSAWAARVPLDYALSTAGMMLAALAVLMAGAAVRCSGLTETALNGLTLAWYIAAILNVGIACLQMFAPQWTDGQWIAQSQMLGRGIGNLRQPNLMALLLIWALISVLWWEGQGRVSSKLALLLSAPLIFGLVVAASRAGVIGLLALSAWSWSGRRKKTLAYRSFSLRFAPALLLLSWGLLLLLSTLAHIDFAATKRAAEGASSPGRVAILHDAWTLVQSHPWLGVGWGGLNFSWALTPNPHRANYNFDHTHNLIAQWFVELGVPMALLLSLLLVAVLWRLAKSARNAQGTTAANARTCCTAVVLFIVAHNQLEFPFWYAYFLLPTAFCLGIALPSASEPARTTASTTPTMRISGLTLMLGAALLVFDYMKVAPIFSIYYDDVPIMARLEDGQRSWLFSGGANYASATMRRPGPSTLATAPRAAHSMADPRLLIQWSEAFHAAGQDNKASYLAARAREFHRKEDESYFEPCRNVPMKAQPYQCQSPSDELSYMDFKP